MPSRSDVRARMNVSQSGVQVGERLGFSMFFLVTMVDFRDGQKTF
jgi:hypothetical protein